MKLTSHLTKTEILQEYNKLQKLHETLCKTVGFEPKTDTPKKAASKALSKSPSGQYILNPKTNKQVKATGKIGRKILREACNKDGKFFTKDGRCVECKEGTIYKDKNKCVKIGGRARKSKKAGSPKKKKTTSSKKTSSSAKEAPPVKKKTTSSAKEAPPVKKKTTSPAKEAPPVKKKTTSPAKGIFDSTGTSSSTSTSSGDSS